VAAFALPSANRKQGGNADRERPNAGERQESRRRDPRSREYLVY
jgi:hypothetical protein